MLPSSVLEVTTVSPQVAYHGVPEKAYDFFVEAHLQATLTVKRLHDMESKNPAGLCC